MIRFSRAVFVLFFCPALLLLAACNLQKPASTASPAPTGSFTCDATENGLLVGTGWFTFKPDGTLVDEISGKTGLWTFDPAKEEFTITGALDVERAVYHPKDKSLEIYLKQGTSRTHVTNGVLNCSPGSQ